MDKIVYLVGTGAVIAEMRRQGIEHRLSMVDIGNDILDMSKGIAGKYWRLHQGFGLPPDQDIEAIMSLLEGSTFLESSYFIDVCNELRRLFRIHLISQITEQKVKPNLLASLLYIHRRYGFAMGENGEEPIGILTVNYDSLLEEAYVLVNGGINCAYEFESDTYQSNPTIPPLLKLHGSFNWKISDGNVQISKGFETKDYNDDFSGWMPPSVFKKPSTGVFETVWNKAAGLLTICDKLRVIGSSLRTEDFALLSLIFTSRVKSQISNGKTFDIQLIVPDEDALGNEGKGVQGIMRRLPFMGGMQNLSSLREYKQGEPYTGNVFYDWLKMKTDEIEEHGVPLTDDEFLTVRLWEE